MSLKTQSVLVPPSPPSGPAKNSTTGDDDHLRELAERIKKLLPKEREEVIRYLRVRGIGT
jgi:hypothetical protein